MYQRGIRGAITIENNSIEAVKNAVTELIAEIKNRNKFDDKDISHVIFTFTDDITCVYPAKIAREVFSNWKYVPMMCLNEMSIKNSLRMCLRVLIVINTDIEQSDINHIYLKEAAKLRKDLE